MLLDIQIVAYHVQVAHFLRADHAPWSRALCAQLGADKPPHQPHLLTCSTTDPCPLEPDTAVAAAKTVALLTAQHSSVIDAVFSARVTSASASLNQILAEVPTPLRCAALAAHISAHESCGIVDVADEDTAIHVLQMVAHMPQLQTLVLRSPYIGAQLQLPLQQVGPHMVALAHVTSLRTERFDAHAVAAMMPYVRSMHWLRAVDLRCWRQRRQRKEEDNSLQGSGVLQDVRHLVSLTSLFLSGHALPPVRSRFKQLVRACKRLTALQQLTIEESGLEEDDADGSLQNLGQVLAHRGAAGTGQPTLTRLELRKYAQNTSLLRRCKHVTTLRELVLEGRTSKETWWYDLHVGNFEALSRLELTSFNLSWDHAQWLAINLRKLTNLVHLRIAGACLSQYTAAELQPVLAEMTTLESLAVTGAYKYVDAAEHAQEVAAQQLHAAEVAAWNAIDLDAIDALDIMAHDSDSSDDSDDGAAQQAAGDAQIAQHAQAAQDVQLAQVAQAAAADGAHADAAADAPEAQDDAAAEVEHAGPDAHAVLNIVDVVFAAPGDQPHAGNGAANDPSVLAAADNDAGADAAAGEAANVAEEQAPGAHDSDAHNSEDSDDADAAHWEPDAGGAAEGASANWLGTVQM